MYSDRKESSQIEADEYGTFGKPYVVTQEMVDPVDCCLPGSFLNCPKTTDLGLCPKYMSQRCSSVWDEKCDLYANSIGDDEKSKDFFRDLVSKKYCKLSSTSKCSKFCQPFDPVAQQSPSVCTDIGNEVFKLTQDDIDVGWYKPVNVGPDYMDRCKKDCNLIRPEDIEENDTSINTCLQYGFCHDILQDICSFSSGGVFKNKHLGEYCNHKQNKDRKIDTKFSSENLSESNPDTSEQRVDPVSSSEKSPEQSSKKNWWILLLVLVFLVIGVIAYNYTKRLM